jgi:thioredoxin 1
MNYKEWVGKAELESKIINSNEPKIAIFAAKWCGFCQRFIQLLKGFHPSNSVPEVSVIDTDDGDGSLWNKYQIEIVPTIVVFQQGKEIFRQNGRAMRGLCQSDLESAIKRSIEVSS